MLNCFKCSIKFEDVYEMFIICFIFRKYFSIKFYGKHKHNNVESYYEDLYNIIKDKTMRFIKHYPFATGIHLLKLIMLLLWKE